MPKKILVVSSTYPANQKHNVPAFVEDQLISISSMNSELNFIVLAPHDYGYTSFIDDKKRKIRQHRFHYFYPRRFENLTHFGILPTLKSHRFYLIVLPLFLVFEFIAIFKYAKKYRVDLIYAHWFTPQGFFSILVGRLLNVPVCFTSHSSDVEVMNRIPFGPSLVRWAVRRSSRISAVSKRSYQKIRDFFKDKDWELVKNKVDIIPMGTSLIPDSTPRDFSRVSLSLLFIGRLTEKKGLSYLIRAIKQLKLEGIKVKLNVAGVGPLENQLKKLVAELGVKDEVYFHGFVSGRNKKDLLNSADIFLLPSIVTSDGDMEGLPVSLIEAMASGCICIATTISGADDIVEEGVNGFLIEAYSVQSIVKAVKVVVASGPDRLNIISNNSKRTAQDFTWDVVGCKYYQFLAAALKNDKDSVIE